MLVDHPAVLKPDSILSLIGGGREEKQLATGIYQISHFGMSGWPSGVAKDEQGFVSYDYGVCDSYEQVIKHHPEVNDPDKEFVITLTPIVKADQSASGGWRWHKWGEYIGTLNPQHEYINDEDDTIQKVYVYHIYPLA
jgi:hypothetical protein